VKKVFFTPLNSLVVGASAVTKHVMLVVGVSAAPQRTLSVSMKVCCDGLSSSFGKELNSPSTRMRGMSVMLIGAHARAALEAR
jgi:hypothetical protein